MKAQSLVKLSDSPVEDVPFCALSRPACSIPKAPQEVDVGPHIYPATEHHCMILQNRGPVDQPVELHCSLDYHREHVRGNGHLTMGHDYRHIIPMVRKGGI